MRQTYVFRKVEESEELRKIFALRYQIISKCHLAPFLEQNCEGIDIAPYDVNAIHYGLYLQEQLIGTIRVVKPHDKYTNPIVSSILLGHYRNNIDQSSNTDAIAPLPFLEYGADIPEHLQYYNSCKDRNIEIVEGGRFVILPEYRNIRVFKFFIESVFASCFILENKFTHAVATCTIDHAHFYRFYGFNVIGPEHGYVVNGTKLVTFSVPLGTLLPIPGQFHEKFRQLAFTFSTTGQIECQI